MFTFLLIVQTVIAATLVGVILVQRSEGGGLGVGGSSSGFMTARGAADFLTRSTSVLGALFIILSIALAGYAGINRKPVTIDTSLVNQSAPAAVAPAVPVANQAVPVANQAVPVANQAVPVANEAVPTVPLAQ